jgi:hypothetical protein
MEEAMKLTEHILVVPRCNLGHDNHTDRLSRIQQQPAV